MSVCDSYRLQAYVDGQLGEAEALALQAHLADCASCRRVVQGLRMVVQPLRLSPEAAPEGLRDRLLAAVAGLEPLRALDCATAQQYVSLRLDGELPLADCQRLAAHLDACATCARAASETELTSRMLRAVEPAAAPLGLLQRIQQATAEVETPAPILTLWRRWVPQMAGIAAAAVLVVGLLIHQPQPLTVAPLVAQRPVIERVASPARQPAPKPVEIASVSAPHVTTVTASKLAAERPRPLTVAAAIPVRSSAAAAHTAAVAWSSVAPAMATTSEVHRPVTLPVASSRTTDPDSSAREVALAPAVHTEAPVAPVARGDDTPSSAMRVAAVDTYKATPAAEIATRVASNNHRRPTWVSRATAAEREVYASDSADETRLADARTRLKDNARRIVDDEVRGFTIR